MSKSNINPPIHFWVIAVIALIWNIMGVMAYLGQVYITEEALALLTEAEQLYIENVATWVTAAYAIAVFMGVFASITLLIRKKIALLFYFISLIAVLAQSSYNYFIQQYMPINTVQFIWSLIIISICLFLIWYTKYSTKRNWIS